MKNIKAGSKVRCILSTSDFTKGKIYPVTEVIKDPFFRVTIKDDISEDSGGMSWLTAYFDIVKQPSLTISILPVKGKTPSFRFQFKSKNGEILNDKYPTKGNALRAVKKLIKQIQENDFEIVK